MIQLQHQLQKILTDSFPYGVVYLKEIRSSRESSPLVSIGSFGSSITVIPGRITTTVRFDVCIDRMAMLTANSDMMDMRMSISKILNQRICRYEMRMDPCRDGIIMHYELIVDDIEDLIREVNKDIEKAALAEFDEEVEKLLSR